MKRYEGLFILNTAGQEDTIQEIVDKLSADITEAGGKVEAVQKMDKRQFARVAKKKHQEGFYVNVIFEAGPDISKALQVKYALDETVFSMLITTSPAPAAA